ELCGFWIDQIDDVDDGPRRSRIAVESRFPFCLRDLVVELADVRQRAVTLVDLVEQFAALPTLPAACVSDHEQRLGYGQIIGVPTAINAFRLGALEQALL